MRQLSSDYANFIKIDTITRLEQKHHLRSHWSIVYNAILVDAKWYFTIHGPIASLFALEAFYFKTALLIGTQHIAMLSEAGSEILKAS